MEEVAELANENRVLDEKRLAEYDRLLAQRAREEKPEEVPTVEDPRMRELLLGATEGVSFPSKLGLQFCRSETGGKSEAYRVLKTREEKQKFRKAWAEAGQGEAVPTEGVLQG